MKVTATNLILSDLLVGENSAYSTFREAKVDILHGKNAMYYFGHVVN